MTNYIVKLALQIPLRGSKLLFVVLLMYMLYTPLNISDACSSRSLPKPRPSTSTAAISAGTLSASTRSVGVLPTTIKITTTTTTTTITTTTTTTAIPTTSPRPNITFPTYKCPANYDEWYCLNDAACFSIKIGETVMYSCECAIGFMGQHCEYKELDGSYLPQRPRPILEKASIANVSTCALLFMVFLCMVLYLRYDKRTKIESEIYVESTLCVYCHDKRCCGSGRKFLMSYDDGLKPSDDRGFLSFLQAHFIGFDYKRSTKM